MSSGGRTDKVQVGGRKKNRGGPKTSITTRESLDPNGKVTARTTTVVETRGRRTGPIKTGQEKVAMTSVPEGFPVGGSEMHCKNSGAKVAAAQVRYAGCMARMGNTLDKYKEATKQLYKDLPNKNKEPAGPPECKGQGIAARRAARKLDACSQNPGFAEKFMVDRLERERPMWGPQIEKDANGNAKYIKGPWVDYDAIADKWRKGAGKLQRRAANMMKTADTLGSWNYQPDFESLGPPRETKPVATTLTPARQAGIAAATRANQTADESAGKPRPGSARLVTRQTQMTATELLARQSPASTYVPSPGTRPDSRTVNAMLPSSQRR